MERSIVIREIDETTAEWLDQEATRRGQSVEEVALDLLRQGIEHAQLVTYHDLDALAGTWGEEDETEFLQAVKALRKTDEELWTSQES